MAIPLLLASTSPARRALMDALGIRYQAEAPGVDEAVAPGTPARAAVAELARRKAEAIRSRRPDALVLAADQLAAIDGQVLGKPPDRAAAGAQLRRLSGRTHEIITGVCLLGPGFSEEAVEVSRLTVYRLADDELERYLDLEEWRGCAGGYRVEGAGQALFEAIDGDRTNVQGLPMVLVAGMLRRAGVAFFERR